MRRKGQRLGKSIQPAADDDNVGLVAFSHIQTLKRVWRN
jgi:hypothetical protein